ncbi:exonuclease VIII [Arthrobacter phage vB_ArS-ArV2]|uniref:Exonuclease n=1 Tax=Arthrobacter phage vB_ArS-ArV2 TaxID=1414742 RepID=V5R922_9CAUD|nr:exonuclease VIII [Arthrobacter phage vB_ArS-ArV2]AHB31663.1 exonuclease [Arthrobacter phage vB_ArS-ArV2]
MPYSPGIYEAISNTEYHKDPALGSTSLKTLATRTPAHWKWEAEHPVHKDVYDIGTVAHSLILEGDESGVVIVDATDWRTKAAKEAKDGARAAGKIALLQKEFDPILAMRDAVMAHPLARAAFTGHRAEHSVFWEEDGLALKCRPDAWQPGKLWDLKSTINADPNEFGKTAHNYGYHQSAAHYIDGIKELTGEELPFGFVLVEKTAPYLVSVVELDWEAIDLGRALNDRAKRIYRDCTETGKWPGYPAVEPVALPTYAVYQTEELLGINTDLELSL